MSTSDRQARRIERLLVLIRHGKAAPKNVGLSDFERILTLKGGRECGRVAKAVADMGIKFDILISSPADRALETAHRVASAVNYPYLKIRIDDALYSSGTTRTLVAQIQKIDRKCKVVALCGHNPAIDNLAAHFVPKFGDSVEKGAMVGIALGSESWRKAAKGSGSIRFIVTPSQVSTTNTQPKQKRRPRTS